MYQKLNNIHSTFFFFAGKITVLQLSALLKQADSSKHKLTLTRLSSAPIPFMVLSLSGNPWNEDLLAVCGLKECHVLTFNSGGKLDTRYLNLIYLIIFIAPVLLRIVRYTTHLQAMRSSSFIVRSRPYTCW